MGAVQAETEHLQFGRVRRRGDEAYFAIQFIGIAVAAVVNDDHFAVSGAIFQNRNKRLFQTLWLVSHRNQN